jgi:hypothetical protein
VSPLPVPPRLVDPEVQRLLGRTDRVTWLRGTEYIVQSKSDRALGVPGGAPCHLSIVILTDNALADGPLGVYQAVLAKAVADFLSALVDGDGPLT